AGELALRTVAGTFHAQPAPERKVGEAVWLGFRPEVVKLGANELNSFQTIVRQVGYLGEIEQYELELSAGVQIKAFEQNPLEFGRVGSAVMVHVLPQDLLVLPRDKNLS